MPEKLTINWAADNSGSCFRSWKRWLESAAREPFDSDGNVFFYTFQDFLTAYAANEIAKIQKKKTDSGDGEDADAFARKASLQGDILEIDLARARNEVIPSETAFRLMENVLVALRRRILTSNLPQESKDEFLKELQKSFTDEDFVEQQEFDQGTPAEMAADIRPPGTS